MSPSRPTGSSEAMTAPTIPGSPPPGGPPVRDQRGRRGGGQGRASTPGGPGVAALGERLRGLMGRAATTLATWRELAEPVLRPAAAVLRCVSPLGWQVATAASGAWSVGWALGWQELTYAATGLAALLLLSGLLTIGRMSLEVTVKVEPPRVRAGEAAAAEVRVRNLGTAPLLPLPLDLPTGEAVTRFNLPALGPGGDFQDVVVLPTARRGVHTVGPATTLRGDPFGLVRRQVTWTAPTELFVHPRTVFLDSLGTGLLKDLEGRSTNDVSMSDLAFHTLREYAPGDDRRHIHWLSSAKRSGAAGSDQFMVRQFLDTRRSHVGIVVDCHESCWLDPEEFETAVAVGASMAVRALLDEMDVSEAGGPFLLTRPRRHTALDLFSRLRLVPDPVEKVAARLARAAPHISAAALVTGPLTSFETLRRAAGVFSPAVTVVAVRVEHGAATGLQRTGGLTVLTIGRLADLPRALSGRLTG
jgi:uncharacterized protein (DUF58 family)